MLHQKRASLSLLTSQYDELLNESNKDPLTGLANRRAFEALVEKADNLPANSAALMIDIDHFKRVNDTRGHLFGDQILKRFGELIRDCIAQNDVVYRYGGEEFEASGIHVGEKQPAIPANLRLDNSFDGLEMFH